MKTSQLTGADLNRAVAMTLGHKAYKISHPMEPHNAGRWVLSTHGDEPCWMQSKPIPDYSSNISLTWPLMIERNIELTCNDNGYWYANCTKYWHGTYDKDPIAAVLRLIVCMKLGDDVDLEAT